MSEKIPVSKHLEKESLDYYVYTVPENFEQLVPDENWTFILRTIKILRLLVQETIK